MRGSLRCRAPPGARGLKQADSINEAALDKSRSARGAWIGTRERKHAHLDFSSRSARGAWIETSYSPQCEEDYEASRSARGAWIETHPCDVCAISFKCRAPPGARGLKQSIIFNYHAKTMLSDPLGELLYMSHATQRSRLQ